MDLKQNLNAFAYMIQAALPLTAFLIFGFQKVGILVHSALHLAYERRMWQWRGSPGTASRSGTRRIQAEGPSILVKLLGPSRVPPS